MSACLKKLQEIKTYCETHVCDDDLKHLIIEMERIAFEQDHNALEFKEIADHIQDGIYISDGEGYTLFVNKAYSRITGIKPEQLIGKNVKEITEKYMFYKNAVTMKVIEEKKRVDSIGESLVNNQKMLITGNPIFDEAGNVKRVVINNRVLTDLESLMHQLENTKDKLQIFSQENRKQNYEIDHFRKTQRESKFFIGSGAHYDAMRKLIDQIAPTEATVLITGPTGTGKEVVANEIVRKSRRSDQPYIKINCSAIPGNLLESELFGYEKGSFTGANREGKMGLFEIANGGTLLLDEIGDMPLDLQSKMLRVLQEKEVKRIGSYKTIPIDVRIVAATNKQLRAEVKAGHFREDLFYRLNVIPMQLMPLSERPDDIEIFAKFFLAEYNKRYKKAIALDEACMRILKFYEWPGNIREFKNIVERLVVISNDNEEVFSHLQNMLQVDPIPMQLSYEKSYKEMVQDFERALLSRALKEYKTTTNAAKHLKLDQSTIVKKRQRLGI